LNNEEVVLYYKLFCAQYMFCKHKEITIHLNLYNPIRVLKRIMTERFQLFDNL